MLFTVPTLILLFAISTVALPAARKKFFPEIAICNEYEARSNLEPSQKLHIPPYNIMIWDEIWGLGLLVLNVFISFQIYVKTENMGTPVLKSSYHNIGITVNEFQGPFNTP
jgi:hypothetical protein